MKNVIWKLGICFGLGVELLLAQGEAKHTQLKIIPSPLQWMNQPEHFSISEEAITITAGKGTDFHCHTEGGQRPANAPLLLFAPDDAFVLTTKLTAELGKEFDSGFLVVYLDEDHWAKLILEKSHFGTFSLCTSVTNTFTDDGVHDDIPSPQVYLRVAKFGDSFAFYISLDGRGWKSLRLFRFPKRGKIRVGFASQSPIGDQCQSTFSKIQYSPKGPIDFWTGAPEGISTESVKIP